MKKLTLTLLLTSIVLLAACKPSAQPADKFPEENRTYCDKDNRPEVCIEVYEPVCGDNNQTYSNGCHACADQNVTFHIPGECGEY